MAKYTSVLAAVAGVTRSYFFLVVGLFFWASAAAAMLPPDKVIEQTSEQMIAALDENRDALGTDSGLVYALIDKIALPHFDIETIARQILGKTWRKASPDQRQRFSHEFQTFIMNTYAKQLMRYSDEQIRVEPLKAEALKSHYVTVRSQIDTRNAGPIAVDYRLHMQDGEWKICDFTVEGVSLVINYRASFASEIRKSGLDALIDRLAEHNAQFKLDGS